ncbi:DNA-binding MarR family transcriptional regulator [Caulobacter ginsengisoli]|uniref:DNA-binding MarR family transcriptional regulator n=1 Tax=Caulobacter ginsengisoli TaxID=400775 RepID=A0ABU0IMS4_9CAUL|nr:MarR family winged helix-turn-helix transcriptional regulator [Caulobacter ginsengisoli]MDQ0462691.1 DNA-binding MarR family transcriptional regulator [Caulobacter ginsengisoli]
MILDDLHAVLLDLAGMLNRPQPDLALLQAAGVKLDRALFPLLSRVALNEPVGVGELGELVGRDYSTVSRQVAKLESLGLVERRKSAVDSRVNEARLTEAGRALVERLAVARRTLAGEALADWSQEDLETLVRLLRRLAGSANSVT